MPGVPNGYLTLYGADLVGLSQAEAAVKKTPTKAPNISGITTPGLLDDRVPPEQALRASA